MSIRRKIVISNFLIIVVPLVLIFLMALLWINTAGKRYWQPIEEMYEDRNGAVSAQNLIYAYQEELWDTNWRELEGADQAKEPADGFRQSQEMVKLQKELTELGYHFSVFLDGESLYSNITEEEWPQLYRMIGSVPSLVHSVMVGNDFGDKMQLLRKRAGMRRGCVQQCRRKYS